MAWTTPRDWTTNELVTATLLNTHLRDNLSYLLARPAGSIARVAGSDYSTSSTSWVNIDATNLSITKTIKSGQALALAALWGKCSTGGYRAHFTFAVDSGGQLGHATYGLWNYLINSANAVYPVMLVGLFTGLSAASHVFTLQYKAASGVTVYAYSTDTPITFVILEV